MVSIRCRALDVAIGERRILSGIDLDLAGGALIGVIGPNGAGKSTLARAILHLLPASAGTIEIDGDDVSRLSPAVGRCGGTASGAAERNGSGGRASRKVTPAAPRALVTRTAEMKRVPSDTVSFSRDAPAAVAEYRSALWYARFADCVG